MRCSAHKYQVLAALFVQKLPSISKYCQFSITYTMAASIVQLQPIIGNLTYKRRHSLDAGWKVVKKIGLQNKHHCISVLEDQTIEDLSSEISQGIAAAIAIGTSNPDHQHEEVREILYYFH